MKKRVGANKRITAIVLVLSLLFTSVGGSLADWYGALAEEMSASVDTDADSSSSSDSDSHESSGDDSHESSGDDSHESSGDDSHESSGDDSRESSSDDSRESSGDDSRESSGDDSHESSGDDSHESSGDDSHESSGDDSHESSEDGHTDGSESREDSGSSDGEPTVIWGDSPSQDAADNSDDASASASDEPVIQWDGASDSDSESSGEQVIVWDDNPDPDSSSSSDEDQDDMAAQETESDGAGDSMPAGTDDASPEDIENIPSESNAFEAVVVSETAKGDEGAPASPSDSENSDTASEPEMMMPEYVEVIIGSEADQTVQTVLDTADSASSNDEDQDGVAAQETENKGARAVSDGQENAEEAPVSSVDAENSDTASKPEMMMPEYDEFIIEAEADQPAVQTAFGIEAQAASAGKSELQTKIEESVGKLSALNERITIILNKNTTYEGDISLKKQDDKKYGENFGIELVAEDAGDDGLKSDATAVIAGKIEIKGINVAIRGISIAEGNVVTVEAAKLNYTGTSKDDTLTLEAKKGAEVTVNTGAGADTVNATASAGAKSVELLTGDDKDELTVKVFDGKVTADTGAGNDTIEAELMASSDDAVTLSGGDGDDEITVKNASAKGDKKIEGGTGEDTIEVDALPGTNRFTVDAGEDSDTVTLKNSGKPTGAKPVGSVSVSTGEGMDQVIVDTSLSDSVQSVNVTGGEGSDRVHLTGKLDTKTKEDQRITGTASALKLIGPNANPLNIATKNVDRFTDELSGKRTVKLAPGANDDNYTVKVKGSSFTDYVFTAPVNHLSAINVITQDSDPLLAKVIIDSAKTLDTGNKLDLSAIDVRNMDLLIKGKDIAINGSIMADGVDIVASDGTGENPARYAELYEKYRNVQKQLYMDIPGMSQAAAGAAAGLEKALDLFDVNDSATVTIGKNAFIYSAGDIIILAKVKQDGGIIRLLPGLNVVNVKVSKASVDVAGKLYAGYDFKSKKVGEGDGSVSIGTNIDVTAGYDAKGNAYEGLPIAVTVVSAESGTHIRKDAVINAAGDADIASKSKVKVSTRADSGLGGAPLAIAVSVLNNDVSSIIEGRIDAGSSVKVSAKGDMDDATSSGKGSGQNSISGGYISVAVALQDVQAKVADKATVKAKYNVKVTSDASQKVNTNATSGALDSGNGAVSGGINKGVDMLVKFWPKIKDFISEKSAQEKLEEAINKMATSDVNVKLDANASKKGDAKVKLLMGDEQRIAEVTVTPWPGYKVKSVTWRGLEPGNSTYSYGDDAVDLSGKGKGPYRFAIPYENVTVFVEYEELSAQEKQQEDLSLNTSDLFEERDKSKGADVSEIYSDATNGAANDADDEGDLGLGDLFDPIPLKLSGEGGGAVLTYQENPRKKGESLDAVKPGAKLELVPNPEKGKALKQGGLELTYKVTGDDGKPVSKTIVVNADDQGHFIATVPENAVGEVSVKGSFVDSDSQNAESDTTQFQATGTVAVTVSVNDSHAVIDTGAQVTAGGSVTVKSDAKTDVSSDADGTASTKAKAADADKKGKKDKKAIEKPDPKTYTEYAVGGREYALVIGATQNGQVKYNTKEAGKYIYTLEATPDAGYSVTGARFSFLVDGKRQNVELKPGADGKYTLDLLSISAPGLTGKAMDKGSLGEVCFTFGKKDAQGNVDITVSSTHEAQTVIANPVKISYNALKLDKKVDPDNVGYDFVGTLTYSGVEEGKLRFRVSADAKKGYTISAADPKSTDKSNKDALWASWLDENGEEQKAALSRDARGYYLDPAKNNVPVGAVITVNANFTEDSHSFTLDESFDAKKAHGTVTLYDESLKAGDKPAITVKADSGYTAGDVTITYWALNPKTSLQEKKTLTLTPDDKGEVELKDGLPVMASGRSIYVSAEFKEKNIGLSATGVVDGKADAKNVKLSESIVSVGNKVTVSPKDDLAKQGYKIGKITLTYTDTKGETQTATFDGDSFKVPKDANEARDAQGRTAQMQLSATMEKKEVALEDAKLENGKVSADTARADRGELVSVTVTPDGVFRVKKGTLKAVLAQNDGSTTREIYLNRSNDTTYTFVVPSDIEDPSKVKITFTGEFEPGQSDSSAVETSLGAGAAITVANGESRAEIMGGSTVTAGKNVTVDAGASGGAKTSSKAGYSKGNIGVGGAVSVQVASLDAKALIHKDAVVTNNGKLSMTVKSKLKFDVKANASSKDMAGNLGVGAGVAVAVNGADAAAAINDGAKLQGKLSEVALSASQDVSDKVTAKAGAKGGVSLTPAVAVDVTGTSAYAYLGKVSDNALKVKDKVKLSATEKASHAVSVDASAAGASVAVGGAYDVSVVGDNATAKLNQSIDAKELSVAAVTESAMEGNATAGASGGEKAKGDKSGKSGKTDKQVDGLLSGAAKLAGKNKSKSVSTEKVGAAATNRQKAQTSEGSVAGAAAVAVNIQTSESRAEVLNGVNITTSGKTAVTAQNRTTSQVKANASTTKSDFGVGAGVAINIINLNNIANVGDGEITAAALEVAATMKAEKAKNGTVIKADTRDALSVYLGETIGEFVNNLAKEIGLTKALSDDIVKDLTKDMVQALTKEFINTTGLGDLLGSGDFSAKLKKAAEMVSKSKDGLLSLPEKLAQPFIDAYQEVATLRDADLSRLKTLFVDQLTTQLKSEALNLPSRIFTRTKDGLVKFFSENAADVLSGGLSKETAGKVFDKVYETALNAAKVELKEALKEMVRTTVTRISTELPAVNASNAQRVSELFGTFSDAYEQQSFDAILNAVSGYLTTTFRENVFDYEAMMTKVAETDFKKKIADGLRAAAKKGAVALTNTAISRLTNHMDVVLEAESTGEKHVFDTQAISGSGAKDVGIAGSVALTIVNANTVASVADSNGNINVTGEVAVNAVENRKVNNVASAAIDARGNADDNKAADKSKDTGSGDQAGSKVEGKGVTLNTSAGGTAEIKPNDLNSNKPKIYVKAADGYSLPKDNKATASYSDDKGVEVVNTITIKKDGNGYYIDPTDIKTDKDVNLTLAFEENLHTINKAEAEHYDDKSVVAGAVKVSAEGREVKDGKLTVREGEMVNVAVQRQKGSRVKEIVYWVKDEKGEMQEVKVDTAKSQAGSNADETIYTFEMPGGDIQAVTVFYEAGEEEASTTDGTGKSVGLGASFAMVYGDDTVSATIGRRNQVNTGALTVKAASDHKEKIASAAGADPFKGTSDTGNKDFALDASVALNVLDNHITAGVLNANTVKANGQGTFDKDGKRTGNAGTLTIAANEKSVTDTFSSAYATGSSTAVGATVALNIASSSVDAKLNASNGVEVRYDAKVKADNHNEDSTSAIATALGADVQRALNKVADGAKAAEDSANKLLDGSYLDKKSDDKSDKTNSGNETAAKINERLDKKKTIDGKNASDKLSLSSNALRGQDVSTQDASKGDGAKNEAGDALKDATGKAVGTQTAESTASKFQVAAAVGITIASHAANASVILGKGKAIKSSEGSVEVTAGNTGNFNTLGTAASMTLEKKGSSIAAGVAVGVNKNTARAQLYGSVSAKQDVSIKSDLTQNMDGTFRGKLGAQALAGAVSGADSAASIGGAVAVLVSSAESSAGATQSEATINAGNKLTITATDKSKLAMRAGGVSLSRGSTVGMGLSVAVLTSKNTIKAQIADYTKVTAKDVELAAKKLAVTWADYKSVLGLSNLVTDSSKLDAANRDNAETGIFDLKKGKGDDNYSVKVNLDTRKALNAVNALNFLSSTNYYVEAVAGSAMTGSGKLSAAGSFAISDMANTVTTRIGLSTTINAENGSLKAEANAENNARVIGGAVSVGSAKLGAGLTFTYVGNDDRATVETARRAELRAKDITLAASVKTQIQNYNAAAAVAAGANAAGGAVNVIVTGSRADNRIGDYANIQADEKARVTANTDADLSLISVSGNVSTGTTAAGGTVAVIVDKAASLVNVNSNAHIRGYNAVDILADNHDRLYSILASASAAKTAGVAGAINTMISRTKGNVNIGGGAGDITGGTINMLANTSTRTLNVTAAAAGAGTAAVGASVNVNVFGRESAVTVRGGNNYKIDGRDVNIRADGRDTTILVGAAVAGAGTAGVSGNVPVLVSSNTVKAELSDLTLHSAQNINVASKLVDHTYAIAGTIAAGGTAGVGVSAVTVVKKNAVTTDLKNVNADAEGEINVTANAKDTTIVGAAGIAAGGAAGVTGSAATLVNSNTVRTDTSTSTLRSSERPISVDAVDDSVIRMLAGGVNASGTAAVGASAVTMISDKSVDTLIGKAIGVWMDVNVHARADNTDDLQLLAVSAGGAGVAAVEIGAAVQILKSRVHARAMDNIQANGIDIIANNRTKLVNSAVAVAGSGVAAVTPVAVVTYFKGETIAETSDKAAVSLQAGNNVNIKADSSKDIRAYTVGAAGSGVAGVSGAATVVVAKDTTQATVAKQTKISKRIQTPKLTVDAVSNYKLRSASAAVGAAGVAGVAVNAMVTVLRGNTKAEMAGEADVKGVDVHAKAKRDVVNAAATVGGAGVAGVGATVLVLSAGAKLSQDAADQLSYGNGQRGRGNKTFDAAKVAGSYKNNSSQSAYAGELDTLEADLQGDGAKDSDIHVGSDKGFDAVGSLRSSDFDNSNYQDGGDTQRGENMKAEETADLRNAKGMGANMSMAEPEDSVVAIIAESAKVTTEGDVNVKAEQPTQADLFGGTVGAAGVAGVGASVAVAVMRSNVAASSLGEMQMKGHKLNVTASSTSGSGDNDDMTAEKARDEAIKKSVGKDLAEKLDFSKRGIRAVGLSVGGAFVGVGVAVSVVRSDNVTKALVGGRISDVSGMDIRGISNYDNTLAATLAAGAGAVAVSASVAVANSEGEVSAVMDDSARVKLFRNEGSKPNDINIATEAKVKTGAIAAGASAGGVGVNAGVAITGNRLNQKTAIYRTAEIDGSEKGWYNVNVTAKSDTNATADLLSVSASGIAAGLGAGITTVAPTIDTNVADEGGSYSNKGIDGYGSLRLNIENDISSSATPRQFSAAAGAAALNGTALLAFNYTKANAKLGKMKIEAKAVKVRSTMKATGVSDVTTAAAGGVAGGISVNYVDLNAENTAEVDNNRRMFIGSEGIKVDTAGTESNVKAASIAANAGTINAGLNAAIARNRTANKAIFKGSDEVDSVGDITLNAAAKATTLGRVEGKDIGKANVGASFALALNEASSRAESENWNKMDYLLDVAAGLEGKTDAQIVTGGGGIVGAKASVAVAYGRTKSEVEVKQANGTSPDKLGGIRVRNTGKNAVNVDISNGGMGVIAGVVLGGAAYGQDAYTSHVTLNSENGPVNFNLEKLEDTLENKTTVTANVTPSLGGVAKNAAGLKVNLATAKSSVKSENILTVDVVKVKVDKEDVNVLTNGSNEANAKVNTPSKTINAASLALNYAKADIAAGQSAKLRVTNNGSLDAAKSVNVNSSYDLNNAEATVGSPTNSHRARDISVLGGVKLSYANAYSHASNEAAIEGESDTKYRGSITAENLTVKADYDRGHGRSIAETQAGDNVGLATFGSLSAEAWSRNVGNVALKGVNVNTRKDVTLSGKQRGVASGSGSAPGSITAVEGSTSRVRAGVGWQGSKDNEQTLTIEVGDDVAVKAGGAFTIDAENSSTVNAELKKKTNFTLGQISDSSIPTMQYLRTRVELGKRANVRADGGIKIKALNDYNGTSKVDADSLSLALNVSTMKGSNDVSGYEVVRLGENARLDTTGGKKDIQIIASDHSDLSASTNFAGKFSAVGGDKATAENTVSRDYLVELGNGASLLSGGGVDITAEAGKSEKIETSAFAKSSGLMKLARTRAETKLKSSSEIRLNRGTNITSNEEMNLYSRATNGDIVTKAVSRTISGGNAPLSDAIASLNTSAKVEVLGTGADRVRLIQNARDKDILISAVSNGMHLETDAGTSGVGAKGASVADAHNTTNMVHRITVNYVDFVNRGGRVSLRAMPTYWRNGETRKNIVTSAWSDLYAYTGVMKPTAKLDGTVDSSIRSATDTVVYYGGKGFEHQRAGARDNFFIVFSAESSRIQIPWVNIPLTPAFKFTTTVNNLVDVGVCDLCIHKPLTGAEVSAPRNEGSGVSTRIPIGGVAMGNNTAPQSQLDRIMQTENLVGLITKDPGSIFFVHSVAPLGKMAFRAGLNRDRRKLGSDLFIDQMCVMLTRDVSLEGDQLKRYRLGNNAVTYLDNYLLPNGARLMMSAGQRVQFVSDALLGDFYGGDYLMEIQVVNPLTRRAAEEPVFPLSEHSTIDLNNGILSVPSQAQTYLYLDDISAEWFKSQFDDGVFRLMVCDPPKATLEEILSEKVEGKVLEGVFEDQWLGLDDEGYKVLWLGRTPEQAESDDEPLYYALVNLLADAVDIYRTSRHLVETGADAILQSVVLYRDAEYDRRGEVCYNLMCYDLDEDDDYANLTVSTDLPGNDNLEMPASMKLRLRKISVDFTDEPVYSAAGCLYMLNRLVDGKASLFDGYYNVTFDGNTFDSGFTRIEGVNTGNPVVTLTHDQPIWIEKNGEDRATDIANNAYILTEGEWRLEE